MNTTSPIQGVFAAAVTPLKPDLSPDLDGLIQLIHFLAHRGCHGILILGTTGEGPSYSINERLAIYQAAASARQDIPGLKMLAGTGTPSLEDTIFLTRSVFNLGLDGAVILPPYYFRKATDEGLYTWFSQVIKTSVPADRGIFGYHFPSVSGVGLSLDILSRLKDTYPSQFQGLKDSSADPEWAKALGKRFGKDLHVLTGNDRLFTLALEYQASGCITAMANLLSPLLRSVWDNFQAGRPDEINQSRLDRARQVLDRYPPFPPLIKIMLSKLHGLPTWKVKPPLTDFNIEQADTVASEFLAAIE